MEQNLTTQQAHALLQKIGSNTIVIKNPYRILKLFFAQFTSLINAILFLAGVFSLVLGNTIDGFFIFAVIVVNGLFGFFQEYRAEKALEKLQDLAEPLSKVIRNNQLTQIPVHLIVPGDIVVVATGDKIPADGILLENYHLEVDESVLTGESIPVIKNAKDTLFRGSFVSRGKGHIRITATGFQTRLGQLAKSLSHIQTSPTPLQKAVTHLSQVLSYGAIALSAFLFVLGAIQGQHFFPLLLLSVSIAVAAIPESLPGVITIALAVGTNRLAKKQAIVRKMASIETLGTTQLIITDKTGTLTQNNMQVKEYFLHKKEDEDKFIEACIRGNNAVIAEEGENPVIIGDKTDGAILLFAQKLRPHGFPNNSHIVDEYEFDSRTKTITTIVKKNTSLFAVVRGAPEQLLEVSTLSEKEKKNVEQQIQLYAQKGLRVIGFGYKTIPHDVRQTRHQAESALEFVGLVGMYDPPREAAKTAIQEAQNQGIRIVMVTGDNPLTAVALAQEIGLTKDDAVITGEEMKHLSNEQLSEAIEKTAVFARTTPEDKLRLTTIAQKMGLIVAVTGDGINDALALEKADVGIAMGEGGTDVAREASDIVLSNDDIFTLIRAIKEGKGIYDNIVKATSYLVIGNLSEILFFVFTTLFDKPLALIPTQILWINLVTDALPALALAGAEETGSAHTSLERSSTILSSRRLFFIALSALFLALLNFLCFSLLILFVPQLAARTITFNFLVIAQLIMALIINKSLRPNTILLFSVFITLLAQIGISTIPFFQHIFQLGW